MNNHRRLALLLLTAVLVLNIIGLLPELTISRVDLNDNVFHYPIVADMVQQIEMGHNPVDWWAPEWSMGYPVLRTYQPLGHLIVALVYFALFKSVSLMTVFVWVRLFSVALLPLTFFVTARLLSFSWLTSAAAAMLAPLISSAGLFGLEYGSYLWAGIGVFTQAVATHFFLLAIGFGYRAIRRGSGMAIAGIFLGLTFLAHFIFGYMAALSLCLLAVIPNRETPLLHRIARTAWVGSIAFIVAAFELMPMLLDGKIINHSRWEPVWKWESFGAGRVMQLLFTGDILDHDRLPIMTLLAVVGLIVYFRDRAPGDSLEKYPARTFIILAAALWILVFFGRPFWGPIIPLLGVSPDMQLHRVAGGAQAFLVLLAAVGLAGLWKFLTQRTNAVVTVVVTAILFLPMVIERGKYLSNNREWGEKSLAAYNANKTAIDAMLAVAKDRGGRAFAGLAAAWGGKFKIGDAPVYSFFSTARIPALSFMYHSMSLTSETMTRFNIFSSAHYRLMDIQTVVAPKGESLPDFLQPIAEVGPLRIFGAPGGGYFDVVDAFYAVTTTKENFYDVNDRWQQSSWVAARQHLLLDMFGDAPPQMPRLSPNDNLPAPPPFPFPGTVISEKDGNQVYSAEIQAARRSYVLFKQTWHPNWRATVDGKPVKTAMLSPGFLGVPVGPGHHVVDLEYRPETWKSVLAIAGFLIAGLLLVGERRGFAPRFNFAIPQFPRPAWVYPALGVVALSVPVCLALVTSKLPQGHDATEYLPRMVEFHENVVHGILLPRWAPDFSHGAGQPLFLFNPPFFYYLAEFWHLLGFNFVHSINLADIVIVLASALGMFLLGRLYFGKRGGYLAAAAYLYAPYFAVDLYVRSAMAEFAAFPFFAFALYGFGAYAKFGRRKYLLIGAASFAGVLLCHNPAALLFAPLLGGFVALHAYFARSWKLFARECAGLVLGFALASFVWVPGLLLNKDIQVQLLSQGYSYYMNHFVYLHQLFDAPWGYGLSVAGDQDGMSFALGWSHLVLIALVIVFIRRIPNRRWFWYFGAMALIFCWMILPAAQPVWEHIQLLQYVAFPWRWLGPIAVALAMLVAALGPVIGSAGKWKNAAFAGALALLIIPNLSHLHPGSTLDIDQAMWTPQQIAQRGIEAASLGEYRPRWMQDWPKYNPRPAEVVSGYASYQQTDRNPIAWAAVVDAKTPATLEMSIAYFPGWSARVDGTPVTKFPSDQGFIRFDVPPGHHTVVLTLTRTPALIAADLTSLAAFIVMLLLAFPPAGLTNIASRLDNDDVALKPVPSRQPIAVKTPPRPRERKPVPATTLKRPAH
jgi:hypothetical protein